MLQNGEVNKRKTRGWTVIDTALLVLVVAMVAGVVYRAVDFFRADRYVTEYHVYFAGTQTVYATVPRQIGERDDVYLYDTDVRLGYIKGENVTVGVSDDYDNVSFSGYFTVDEGEMKDGRLSVSDGKATLAVGEDLVICTDRVALSVHIESIEEQVAKRPSADSTGSVENGETEAVTEASAPEETTEEAGKANGEREDESDGDVTEAGTEAVTEDDVESQALVETTKDPAEETDSTSETETVSE